ncbi:hypothetical protein BpHYR1_026163 [Brachionus plicatilis]|uniref:Uncharacterized protein n=1 Tax=Brachionus plicatilis TaxID=10195 RepID=A0A3M7T776_BRAPC|nr:hypothetical protein BpHYR1_026163 [Brachionus plicatilis]
MIMTFFFFQHNVFHGIRFVYSLKYELINISEKPKKINTSKIQIDLIKVGEHKLFTWFHSQLYHIKKLALNIPLQRNRRPGHPKCPKPKSSAK